LEAEASAQGSPGGEPAAGGPAGASGPAGPPQATAAAAHTEQSADEQALQGDVAELVATAAQRDEYLALAQRTQADFENYRKRVARESSVAVQKGVAKLAKEILPALDNLDRALGSAAQDDPLLAGVRLVRSELAAALARVGVESFSPLAERFDPSKHEAMAQVERPEADSGSVVEVYQAGYSMGESIIRPARVVVAA
jgi:molecular chaperone GrpE